MIIPADNVIGAKIIYEDYLGFERYGSIGWIEQYNGPENDDPDSLVVWVYVVDEDPEYNTHEFITNMGTFDKPDIRHIMYADLRLSTELRLDEEE